MWKVIERTVQSAGYSERCGINLCVEGKNFCQKKDKKWVNRDNWTVKFKMLRIQIGKTFLKSKVQLPRANPIYFVMTGGDWEPSPTKTNLDF